MKYALLVYSPEEAWTNEEWSACVEKSTAICHDLQAKGQFIAASPLDPISKATSVRIRQGQTLITAGPFAETVEQLGGFFLIDVPNLDNAIEIAQQLPASKKGTVEIRPIYELTGLPPDQFDSDRHAKLNHPHCMCCSAMPTNKLGTRPDRLRKAWLWRKPSNYRIN